MEVDRTVVRSSHSETQRYGRKFGKITKGTADLWKEIMSGSRPTVLLRCWNPTCEGSGLR
ncbi:hypothetical protein C8R42DRAFT_179176 [Lentinula raphanica]|nr:hypothetical protein C8R42DRAFT_179176 [Lentinula raphanica]